MVDLVKFFRDERRVIMAAPWSFAGAITVGAAIAFTVSEYHYAGRIDGQKETIESLKTTLETKDHPPPLTKTVEVPVSDPAQAQQIRDDRKTIENLSETVRELGARSSAPRPINAPPRAPATISNSQSGGVAQGNGSSIGTVNQNGLPARSVFAAQLGQLYTEGYLLEQKIGMTGIPDAQLADLDKQAETWLSKVINFMNVNMCSDAAAYFLRFHRPSMSYGMPDNQDRLFDHMGIYLDNLSDEKRNDAWDCK